MCFWDRFLFEIWWNLVPISNQVKMILCHKVWHALSRFLNNSPNVLNDFRFCEGAASTMSNPKIKAKSTAKTWTHFETCFSQNLDQKWIQMGTKLAGKSILVVDVISERCWSASEANGVELMTPRRVFFGGGEGTFLGRRTTRTNTHAWFTP